jgi:hypothetical protein
MSLTPQAVIRAPMYVVVIHCEAGSNLPLPHSIHTPQREWEQEGDG